MRHHTVTGRLSPATRHRNSEPHLILAFVRFIQVWLLFRRALRTYMREPLLLRARFAQNVVLGIFVGLLYFQLGLSQASIQDRYGRRRGFCLTFGVIGSGAGRGGGGG